MSILILKTDLLEQASLLTRDGIYVRSPKNKVKLVGLINDCNAYYYMKRNKFSAALQYAMRAINASSKLADWYNLSICQLHAGYILSKLRRRDDALDRMNSVLKYAELGHLNVERTSDNNALHILLVAIAYHNIAVQMVLNEKISQACINSQNARRLLKLCLNYGNIYVNNFESTHRICLDRLMSLSSGTKKQSNEDLKRLFENLVRELYD